MGYIGFIIFIKIGSDPIAIGYAEAPIMSEKEQDKLKIIQLIDTGNLTCTEAADLMGINPFDHLIGAIWRMYQSFHGELSRDAVILLKDLLERLINYYKIHNPIFSPSVFAGQHLIMALREHVGIAPVSGSEKVERKINEIYNALYSDMTIEEVRAEFARIMAPHFRERMGQMEKDESGDDEKPKKKKKRGSKK
jgi:hypothetical protein